jgi:predicted MFS family arabinose efflux permease
MRLERDIWRPAVSGLCAVLIGIGLSRFAYTPLIPALIGEGWFDPADAAYLGAANLAGYLAGALLSGWMARRVPAVFVLRAMLALATAAFFACAWPAGFAWYFLWRFAAGYAGGALMALAAPTALLLVPAARRGFAGGLIFTGVGLGIALSGTLVPLLLLDGLTATWIGLGLLSLVLSLVAWGGWPRAARASAALSSAATPAGRWSGVGLPLAALFVAYGFDAAGIVPHMVFLVDFIARGLGQGIAAGSAYWVVVGIGAAMGAMAAGRLADRVGFTAALRLVLALQAVAAALPAMSHAPLVLGFSSLVIGAFVPGIVPLVLGRVHELLPGDAPRQRAAWSRATVAFALGQAIAGYGFSWLFGATGYVYLFPLAAAAMLLALMVDVAAGAAAHVRRQRLEEKA